MLLALVAACKEPTEPTEPTGSTGLPSTGDTGTTAPVGCRVGDDLKVRCPFERDGAGPIELAIEIPSDGATLRFPGDASALSGELVGWDVPAGEDVYVSITDRGALVEGVGLSVPVPQAAEVVVTTLVDGPSSLDHVVFPFSCSEEPHLMALDARGRVRWLQPLGDATQVVPAVAVTHRGSVLAIPSRETVREWRWDGTPVLDLDQPSGELPRLVHHGADTLGDRTWVLDATAEPFPDGYDYVVDGVTAIDASGRAANVWQVTSILDPQGLTGVPGPSYWYQFHPAIDGVHENSLDVLEDGSWIVSLKHLHLVVKLDAAHQVVWALSGVDPAVRLAEDTLTVAPSADDAHFEFPHDPNIAPWGNLLLLDNGTSGQDARVMEFSIDEGKRIATLARSWVLEGSQCPVQGSVVGLPDGTVFALCARTQELFELDDDGIRRRTQIDCTSGMGGKALSRAFPTDLRE